MNLQGNGFVIRRAFSDDEAQLEFIRSFYFGPFLSWSREDLKSQVERGQVWVLTSEECILAYLSDREVGDDIEVLSLAVSPRHLQRGLMEKLMSELYFDQNKAACQGSVFLEVHEKNQRAIRLYERLNFVLIGRRPVYYSDGGAALVFKRDRRSG